MFLLKTAQLKLWKFLFHPKGTVCRSKHTMIYTHVLNKSARGRIGVFPLAAMAFIGPILTRIWAHRDCSEGHLLQELPDRWRLNGKRLPLSGTNPANPTSNRGASFSVLHRVLGRDCLRLICWSMPLLSGWAQKKEMRMQVCRHKKSRRCFIHIEKNIWVTPW